MTRSENRTPLGRLKPVKPRDIWPDEATHFTPWLAREDNLELLGETIGIALELEAQEKNVGPFRADILCKDKTTDDWVLIENQLARTDHTHLGQLITYAAGLKAVTIIWIADPFTEEHRAALDWLNEITDERFNFLGLEVELWKIGDSPPAPKFNVVSKPNDWTRSVAQAASRMELTPTRQMHLGFWTEFRNFVLAQDTSISPTKPLPQNWMTVAIGRAGFTLSAVTSTYNSELETWESHEVRVDLTIGGDRSNEYLGLLEQDKDEIEETVGYELTWQRGNEDAATKIYVRRNADLHDEESWPELHSWLLSRLEDFDKVFRPRLRALRLPETEADD